MISVIYIVGKWCTDNGMSINEQKTKLVLFTTKRKLSRMNLPKLNAVELSLAEVTFLVFQYRISTQKKELRKPEKSAAMFIEKC